MIPPDDDPSMRPDIVYNLSWVRAVIDKISQNPQLIVWFGDSGQCLNVAMNIGNDGDFQALRRDSTGSAILGCFLEDYKFGPGRRHALSLEKQVTEAFGLCARI